MRQGQAASLRLFSLALVLVSIPGILLVPSPLQSSPNPAAYTPRTIPHTDVNPVGANFFLEREVEPWKQEMTLKMAKEAGIGWIKAQFSWESIEPRKGEFRDSKYRTSTWANYDRIVELADRYGMKVIARVDRPPAWSRQDNSSAGGAPDNYEDFGDFVATVVERYKGKIQYYQIWNEPNLGSEWGKGADPKAYVRLLRIAYQRAKQADPSAVILSAPLAQTLERGPRNLDELDYLQEMYEAGARDYFDILFANAYGFDRPPTDPPDPGVLDFGRLFLLRQVMERNGDAGKPVWINEFGWNASPEDFPAKKLLWRRVSEQQQARYTVQGIELARRLPWVGVVNIWFFRQEGRLNPKTDSDYYFRMVDVDFTPRLVYQSVKKLTQGLEVAAPGYHEETAPAVARRKGWRPKLMAQASGGALLSTEVPGDSVDFTFEGTEVKLVYWGDRTSGRLIVHVDGKNPHLSRRSEDGNSYIDLFTPDAAPVRSEQTVVRGLSPGKHTLTLTLAAKPSPQATGNSAAIDAFIVDSNPALWPFYVFGAIGLVGLIGLLFPVARKRRPRRPPVLLVE